MGLEQEALVHSQFELSVLHSIEDLLKCINMLLKGLGIDYYIIYVHETDVPGETGEYKIH